MLPGSPRLVTGIGDDAAVIAVPQGQVIATTDMLIEGRHFRREWSAPRDIGRKAAARNLADVAAMGAVPTALLVAFAGPGQLEVAWVLDVFAGIAGECSDAGAAVAGGDTSSCDQVILAITALGELAGTRAVTRSGARPGDVIAVAGELGSAAAGLALLSADVPCALPEEEELAGLIAAHRRPRPPYPAGPQAVALGATAMIDISDGLVADLGHVAAASGVRAEIRSGALSGAPVARAGALARAADRVTPPAFSVPLPGPSWIHWVLTGGDDHALAATFPAGTRLPGEWTVIGEMAAGSGVSVDGREWGEKGGWEHFTS